MNDSLLYHYYKEKSENLQSGGHNHMHCERKKVFLSMPGRQYCFCIEALSVSLYSIYSILEVNIYSQCYVHEVFMNAVKFYQMVPFHY